ncbi:MAG: LysE family transporter [Candidatus Portiera sp.]|nr:LysE family transporter [Portiera sp.]
MLQHFLEGFLVGGGLIIAIGAQNAYVLRRGLLRDRIFIVVAICALSDILLIVLGVLGVGLLVSDNTYILQGLALAGAIFLASYGLMAAGRAWQASGSMNIDLDETSSKLSPSGKTSLVSLITTTLALTYLNPHVYLDTVVIFGGIASKLEWQDKMYFMAGGCLASVTWFFVLGYGARLLEPLFKKPQMWRILDVIIAAIMLWLAAGLFLYLIKL